MVVENYRQFGGTLMKLSALRHVACHYRVIGRQTSAPLSETLLFGVAGGIGAMYNLVETPAGASLRLDLGPRYKGLSCEPLQSLCVRLGLPASFRHASCASVARDNLLRPLERGEPVIVCAGAETIPHLGWPGIGEPGYMGVVYSVDGTGDEATALLADVARSPARLPLSALVAVGAGGHLSACVSAPAAPVDLPKALEGGLRACCDRMIDPPHPRHTFGYRALARLADSVAGAGAEEGWERRFAPGAPLLGALLALFSAIELSEVGPQAGRAMFAEFLQEAGAILQGPDLGEAVDRYEALAGGWGAVADAALPSSCPPLAELRRLLLTRLDLLRERGQEATAELLTIRDRYQELRATIERDFPLDAAGVRAIFEELAESMQVLAADEEAAIRGLRLLVR